MQRSFPFGALDDIDEIAQHLVPAMRRFFGMELAPENEVARLADAGFRHLVFTDIARDGMQSGIDVSAYRRIDEAAGFPVVASGGVDSLSDIEELALEGSDVIEGCITGRALYEGALSLEDALVAARGEERSMPC